MLLKYKNKGFTLVELLVALGITSILMLGMSVFFAGTFRQLFEVQEQTSGNQNHFATLEILREKSQNISQLLENSGDHLFVRNQRNGNQALPFSYIGLHDDHLVFKDVFMFNGLIEDLSTDNAQPPNAAGVAYVASSGDYYVAAPLENTIYQCKSFNNCDPFIAEGLNHPTDIATDGVDRLFVSDSGNDRIIEISDIDTSKTITSLVETDLSFPTGIVYYQDPSANEYLFVADTYHDQIKRIDLTGGNTIMSVVGEGDRPDCDSSALYCQLNFPTGLHIDSTNQTLYIADTGNNRVLRMRDPELKINMPTNLEMTFDLDQHYALHSIGFKGEFEGGDYDAEESSLISIPSDYDAASYQFDSQTQTPLQLSDFGNCQSGSNHVYVENLPNGYDLEEEDVLLIDGHMALIENVTEGVSCIQGEGEEATSEPRDRIEISSEEGPFNDGDDLYFSHPLETLFVLEDVEFTESGFQTINVHIFDANDPLVIQESEVIFSRIGDGILGTQEDQMDVFVSGINYPTGLSVHSGQLNVASSLNDEILHFNLDGSPTGDSDPLDSFSVGDMTTFDYQSSFTLDDLSFETLNDEALLQIELSINLINGDTEAYEFTAHIP